MKKYKAKECFIHRQIMDEDFLIKVGSKTADCNGIVMLNETAAFLWNGIQTPAAEEELCAALAENYTAEDEDDFSEDVRQFLETMLSLNAVEEIEQDN